MVYSKETEWDVTNADPQYHYDAILAALKLAKDTLPKVEKLDQLDPTLQIHPNPSIQTEHNFCSNFNLKVIPFVKISKQRRSVDVEVDAIGGSATGTVSALNEATWCDIFPNVPPDVYKAKVVDIFIRLGKDRGSPFFPNKDV